MGGPTGVLLNLHQLAVVEEPQAPLGDAGGRESVSPAASPSSADGRNLGPDTCCSIWGQDLSCHNVATFAEQGPQEHPRDISRHRLANQIGLRASAARGIRSRASTLLLQPQAWVQAELSAYRLPSIRHPPR